MYPTRQTKIPGQDPCADTVRDLFRNYGNQGYVDDLIARLGTATTEFLNECNRTHSGCLSLPLKSGGRLKLTWTRLSDTGAIEGRMSGSSVSSRSSEWIPRTG
jgi:hypothetical protein